MLVTLCVRAHSPTFSASPCLCAWQLEQFEASVVQTCLSYGVADLTDMKVRPPPALGRFTPTPGPTCMR
jgi:hypothetical protein